MLNNNDILLTIIVILSAYVLSGVVLKMAKSISRLLIFLAIVIIITKIVKIM